jgi:adenosine deaminase CECR1
MNEKEGNIFYFMSVSYTITIIISSSCFFLERYNLVKILLQLVDDFKKEHPLFLGMKVILAVARNSDSSSVEAKMQQFVELQEKYPNFLIGFDLVGHEDLGKTLNNYVKNLKEISQNGRFFFHAGETNGFNTEADVNLIDVILMNTKRIGHGFSLYKHPVLWAAFKARDIAIEISPISNQVLHLVQDLRNHPAAFYISENVPIVVSFMIWCVR